MSYEHLVNMLKAIAIAAPAARAFEMTVDFALGQGKDTATVGRLEDHFRDRPAMKACIERMKADPLMKKCFSSMIGPGELGVIAINALQYGYPAFMTLDLGAMALSMMRVEGWGQHIHYVRTGWDMADRIKPLMGVRWEDGLDKPLAVWRKELNIEPIRQGQNSWYEVLGNLEL